MKLLPIVPSILLASSVSARNLFLGNSQASILASDDTDLSVPGDNPLYFCAKPDNYTVTVTHVDLSPYPPKKGQTLSITANATLHADVEEGAKVHLQVKYGLITLISTTEDLCTQLKQVDLECPLKKGKMGLSKDVEIPKEVPPGAYTVHANVTSKDGEIITCLTAKVNFPRGPSLLAGRIHEDM